MARAVTVEDAPGVIPTEFIALTASHTIVNEATPVARAKASSAPTPPGALVYRQMVIDAFLDAPVMVAIAQAESRFVPTAQNPHSTAAGIFQILSSSWKNYGCTGEKYNPEDNIMCARIIYNRDGTKPWNSSKTTWGS